MFSLDEKIGIVIAEDEKLIRQSIIAKIKAADADFEVLAEAENGLAALEAVKKYNPQVVITDIKMPEMDGIALARAL
ncbi:MAG: response regulator, partial [Ruthenibacterium sp.]